MAFVAFLDVCFNSYEVLRVFYTSFLFLLIFRSPTVRLYQPQAGDGRGGFPNLTSCSHLVVCQYRSETTPRCESTGSRGHVLSCSRTALGQLQSGCRPRRPIAGSRRSRGIALRTTLSLRSRVGSVASPLLRSLFCGELPLR